MRESGFYTAEGVRQMWIETRSPALVRSSRQLDPDESRRIWARVKQNWGIDDLAPPRPKGKKSYHHMVIERFDAWPFDPHAESNVCELLRVSLVKLDASRIYELRENHHANHEIDAEAIEAVYWGGWEGIWTDVTLDWLVYADHESSVTVAGGALLAHLRDVWPDWQRWFTGKRRPANEARNDYSRPCCSDAPGYLRVPSHQTLTCCARCREFETAAVRAL